MKYIISIFFVLFLIGYHEPKKSFARYEIENCQGEKKIFTLPSGWSDTIIHYTCHGQIEGLVYPDSSLVLILCAFLTELDSGNQKANLHSRKERVFGQTIIYENVPKSRKRKFDTAFESMME